MTQNASPPYRADIDGLRGVAVLCVVLFHAFPDQIPGGFAGVDMFFVISGYLITGIIADSLKATSSFDFRDFYARRIRRLFPALIVVLVSCLAIGSWVLIPQEYRQLSRSTVASALFVPNLLLLHEVGYFDTAATTKPLLHLWSLGVEEQFYLIWPGIVFLAYRNGGRIYTALVCILLGSFLLDAALVVHHPEAAFYLPVTRFWELLVGGALSVKPPPSGWSRYAAQGAAVGIALLAAAVFGLNTALPYPSWLTVLPVFGTALLIWAGPSTWLNRRLLAFRPLVALGLVSYPFYLWHWPLLSFAQIIDGSVPSGGLRWAIIGISLVLATATFVAVERPIRRLGTRTPVIAVLCAAMAGVVVAGLLGATRASH